MARTLDDGPLSSARATRELPHRRSHPLDVPRLLAHVVLIRSSAAALTELEAECSWWALLLMSATTIHPSAVQCCHRYYSAFAQHGAGLGQPPGGLAFKSHWR